MAASLGLDPRLAVADAMVESGLNPQAVGDGGTSFGLYQLHQGGELGSLTPSQAFDPATNAHVALSTMAQVAQAHPGWSPGQIAAAAQRPADPAAYAAKVDAAYQQLGAGVPSSAELAKWHVPLPFLPPQLMPGGSGIPGVPSASGIAGDVASGVAKGLGDAFITPLKAYLPRLLAILGGIVLLLIAVHVTFSGGGGMHYSDETSRNDDDGTATRTRQFKAGRHSFTRSSEEAAEVAAV